MKTLVVALKLFIVLTVITGVIYPLAITVVGQVLFSDKANGSLIKSAGVVVGSELIGQKFSNEKYFWPRPSAIDYNPLPSGATNWGMTNAQLRDSVNARIDNLRKTYPGLKTIPPDLLFSSGSGLDPDISPEAAKFQVGRVANARKLDIGRQMQLIELVESKIKRQDFGFFGQARVNVLELNLAVDSIFAGTRQ
jgi:potassium-transporting ATPase KdpC subunit